VRIRQGKELTCLVGKRKHNRRRGDKTQRFGGGRNARSCTIKRGRGREEGKLCQEMARECHTLKSSDCGGGVTNAPTNFWKILRLGKREKEEKRRNTRNGVCSEGTREEKKKGIS